MRILAPAYSLTVAETLLSNGADDIYLGGVSDIFNNYSFNGRALTNKSGSRILATSSELKIITKYVHSKGGRVYYAANTPFFLTNNADQYLIDAFSDYIEAGIRAEVDYIILGDIGAILFVRQHFPDIRIATSSYLEVQNEHTIAFFQSIGVQQVILSYQSTLSDIEKISRECNVQLEVFGHGGCSFYVGSCSMFHDMGECGINVGFPCRAMYRVISDGQDMGIHRALDNFKLCSICDLKKLKSMNVNSIKIVGRDTEPSFIARVVKTYREAINLSENEEVIDLAFLPAWWRRNWCENSKLCRFR